MTVVLEIRRRGKQVAGSILSALLFAYFLFHAVQGDRGLLAWVTLKQQVGHASAELAASEADRTRWEKRIALLRSDRLDPDMLDERVRFITGFVQSDELVILNASAVGAR
jgi:cell division protein FtsB